MFKFIFSVPVEDTEKVKQAVFEAGAGTIGAYEQCAWEYPVRGQFKPLNGSNPTIGKQLELTYVDEMKVEMVCPKHHIESVIKALKKAHPYETPAYEVYKIEPY